MVVDVACCLLPIFPMDLHRRLPVVFAQRRLPLQGL